MLRKLIPVVLLYSLLTFGTVDLADAFSMEFPTIADAFVYSYSPNSNYGDATYISASIYDDGARHQCSYLKFNISAIPENMTIILAELRLYVYSSYERGNVSLMSVLNDSWLENAVTWNDRPAPIDELDNREPSTGNHWENWTCTDFVRTEFESGNHMISVHILGTEQTSGGWKGASMYSKEFDGYDPTLYVEYGLAIDFEEFWYELLYGSGRWLALALILLICFMVTRYNKLSNVVVVPFLAFMGLEYYAQIEHDSMFMWSVIICLISALILSLDALFGGDD